MYIKNFFLSFFTKTLISKAVPHLHNLHENPNLVSEHLQSTMCLQAEDPQICGSDVLPAYGEMDWLANIDIFSSDIGLLISTA